MDNGSNSFPATVIEALALLYVQKHSDDLTPEEMVRMYWDAYRRIRDENPTARAVVKSKKD